MEHTVKTLVCVGTYGKPKDNTGSAFEFLKTKQKHWFCVGTYGKRKEDKGFTLEPIENTMETQVFSFNV